jgi:hypothetical protein
MVPLLYVYLHSRVYTLTILMCITLYFKHMTASFSCLHRRPSSDVQEGALFIRLLFLCHIFLVAFDNNICMTHMFMLEMSFFTVCIKNVQ